MAQFVIGIGSQRAGSTLLHKVLDEASPVMMHPVKELHYFDTRNGIRDESVLKEFSRRQVDRELGRYLGAEHPNFMNRRHAWYLNTNWKLYSESIRTIGYRDLFKPFLGLPHLGEATPEYMLLNESQIQDMANRVGEDAKILLITRDPLDRFVSAFKLLKVYGGGEIDPERFSQDMIETFETMPGWIEQQIGLNDYAGAEARFRSVFPHVHVLSYESLISDFDREVGSVGEFLGVDIDMERAREVVGSRVNALGETAELTDEALDLAKKRLGLF